LIRVWRAGSGEAERSTGNSQYVHREKAGTLRLTKYSRSFGGRLFSLPGGDFGVCLGGVDGDFCWATGTGCRTGPGEAGTGATTGRATAWSLCFTGLGAAGLLACAQAVLTVSGSLRIDLMPASCHSFRFMGRSMVVRSNPISSMQCLFWLGRPGLWLYSGYQ